MFCGIEQEGYTENGINVEYRDLEGLQKRFFHIASYELA